MTGLGPASGGHFGRLPPQPSHSLSARTRFLLSRGPPAPLQPAPTPCVQGKHQASKCTWRSATGRTNWLLHSARARPSRDRPTDPGPGPPAGGDGGGLQVSERLLFSNMVVPSLKNERIPGSGKIETDNLERWLSEESPRQERGEWI